MKTRHACDIRLGILGAREIIAAGTREPLAAKMAIGWWLSNINEPAVTAFRRTLEKATQ